MCIESQVSGASFPRQGYWTRLQLLFSATSKAHSALCSGGCVTYMASGRKNVGKGMAIVTVDEIFISNVKPQFLFVSEASPSDSWDKEATTGSLFQQCLELNKDLELMVQTLHLYILVSPNHVSEKKLL